MSHLSPSYFGFRPGAPIFGAPGSDIASEAQKIPVSGALFQGGELLVAVNVSSQLLSGKF